MTDVNEWLSNFNVALSERNLGSMADLFLPNGLWRDYLALGWTLATYEGIENIRKMLSAQLDSSSPGNWETSAAPGESEGFISFETVFGRGRGYVRLVDGKCLTLFTCLEELKGFEEPLRDRRPNGNIEDPQGRSWTDLRAIEAAEMGTVEQPYVLIVGAGQGGLILGARLRMLGIPHLLIDKYPNIGDQWRSRYKSLCLHDPVWYDHMPYLPFPDNWPVFTPKDKMAEWLGSYANTMELNVWTSTECTSASYDEAAGRWNVQVEREGKPLTLRPAHLVMAIGFAGMPRVPEILGQNLFKGVQKHSSEFRGGDGLKGKRVIIVGANNSAHDIADDLVQNGAEPLMIQRSSTLVVRQSVTLEKLYKSLYSQQAVNAGLTTDLADILNVSFPLRLAEPYFKTVWDGIREEEADFYQKLEDKGFMLDFAEDGTGLAMKFQRSASGYYIDVGASQKIIDGKIKVKSGVNIDRIVEDGMILDDGTHLVADMIVYATGFGSMDEWVSHLIGADVAERVGRCGGYGSGFKGDPGPWVGEQRNMWKRTAQPGLWFMGGNLFQGRFYSRLLALQLKADFEGLKVKEYLA